MQKNAEQAQAFRGIPSIDAILSDQRLAPCIERLGREKAAGLAREAVEGLRDALHTGGGPTDRESLQSQAVAEVLGSAERERQRGTRRVINATGVVIHTNLGRAPLSQLAAEAAGRVGGNYSNVEFDMDTGGRGRRGEHAERLLCELTGAEAAAIVNNCAAAAFLVLSVHAAGREVVISRGELVEIGGDFRVPDVLARSGAVLREVGTTNRTKIADYERAINDSTSMLLRVHPSNFKIVGFTASPTNSELAATAHEHGLIFYEDAGSGALVDLGEFGLHDEPVIPRSLNDGADIVTFSGDKLLGGPQAGLIVGKRDLIDDIRCHPLYRALRAGKMTYAALEATLDAYRRGTHMEDIPVLRMLSMQRDELKARADAFIARAGIAATSVRIERVSGHSAVGGGSAPGVQPKAELISITGETHSADGIKSLLRANDPPIAARIEDGRVLLDLRTVEPADEDHIIAALKRVAAASDSASQSGA